MKLQQNTGTPDRAIRLVIAGLLAVAAVTGVVTAPLSYLALGIAAIMLVTAATGYCPIYTILRVSTCPRRA